MNPEQMTQLRQNEERKSFVTGLAMQAGLALLRDVEAHSQDDYAKIAVRAFDFASAMQVRRLERGLEPQL